MLKALANDVAPVPTSREPCERAPARLPCSSAGRDRGGLTRAEALTEHGDSSPAPGSLSAPLRLRSRRLGPRLRGQASAGAAASRRRRTPSGCPRCGGRRGRRLPRGYRRCRAATAQKMAPAGLEAGQLTQARERLDAGRRVRRGDRQDGAAAHHAAERGVMCAGAACARLGAAGGACPAGAAEADLRREPRGARGAWAASLSASASVGMSGSLLVRGRRGGQLCARALRGRSRSPARELAAMPKMLGRPKSEFWTVLSLWAEEVQPTEALRGAMFCFV